MSGYHLLNRGGRWTVNVRWRGERLARTFALKGDAKIWGHRAVAAIDKAAAEGVPFDPRGFLNKESIYATPIELAEAEVEATIAADDDPAPRPDWSLKRGLIEYERKLVDKLKGARQARARVQAWQRDPLSSKRMCDITPEDIDGWMQNRTKKKKIEGRDGKPSFTFAPASASTIRNDLSRLSVLYDTAASPKTKGGWGLTALKNPVSDVALPALLPGRQKRLEAAWRDEPGDEDKLLAAISSGLDADEMRALVILELETGARRSEILDLRAREVRSTDIAMVIEKDTSKNHHRRRIVLSVRAAEAVDRLLQGKSGNDKLFTLNIDAVAYRWDRARARAGLPTLRVHDLRHEGLSRMAEAGLTFAELAAQSGHRSPAMLLRYVNVTDRSIAEKLARK